MDAAIAEQQLDLTEAEFARLLQAATAGHSWERAASVLRRIGSELTVLQPETLARVRALFASPAAAPATGAAGDAWEVGPTTVSPTGQCSSCGGQLKALDLSAEEMRTFAEGIAAIAERQEKRPNDFQQVRGWWWSCVCVCVAGYRGLSAAPLAAPPVRAHNLCSVVSG